MAWDSSGFIRALVERDVDKKIVSVFEFGSSRGYKNHFSDIDLFVVVRRSSDISPIFVLINALNDEILHLDHTPVEDFIKRHFLGSNNMSGLHAIVIAHDELNLDLACRNGRVRVAHSLRLKILTSLFISESLLFFKLKTESTLCYGEDLLRRIHQPVVTWADRARCFSVPVVVLIFAPLSFRDKDIFLAWCFKASLYYKSCIETYIAIKHLESAPVGDRLENPFYKEAEKFRYYPSQYTKSTFELYIKTWWHLLETLSFIWTE